MAERTKKLITIDVGNSRIKLGLFETKETLLAEHKLPEYVRSIAINLDETVPWDELSQWTIGRIKQIDSVILGGVNPRGRDIILDEWPRTGWPPPVVITNPFELPIKIKLNAPRTVGVDRLLNAIAGNMIRQKDRPMIIIDSGTATTIDVISKEGAFEGGSILPGYQLNAMALHQYTALLPHIPNTELAQKIPHALGKNTREALRSGLFWGQFGGVKEIVNLLSSELSDIPELLVTGGAGRMLMPLLEGKVKHEPFLALQGLAIVGLSKMEG